MKCNQIMNNEIVASLWAENMWRETHNRVSGALSNLNCLEEEKLVRNDPILCTWNHKVIIVN